MPNLIHSLDAASMILLVDKFVTEVWSEETFRRKMLTNEISSYKYLSVDRVLVTYKPGLDYETVASHNLDYVKLLNKFKEKELPTRNATSVVISAAITAYPWIHNSKLKLEILNQRGNLYYSYTDTIVTDIELQDSLVSPNKLGLLKLEHVLHEAIFISKKIYWMRDIKAKSMVRAKGIKSSFLSYTDFIKLLNNKNVETAIKTQSKIHWDLGYVSIEDKPKIKINSKSYTKRNKIFNTYNKWLNTNPFFLNKIIKDLNLNIVLYESKGLILYNNIRFLVINRSSLYTRSILIAITLIFIIPVSSIAYVLRLEKKEFNLDEIFVWNKTNNFDENEQLNTNNYPSADTQPTIKPLNH